MSSRGVFPPQSFCDPVFIAYQERLVLPFYPSVVSCNVLSGLYIFKHMSLVTLKCKDLLTNNHCWNFIRLLYFILNYVI